MEFYAVYCFLWKYIRQINNLNGGILVASTYKKAQQLQKKNGAILSAFMQMEETLTAHVEETKKLQSEVKAEIQSKETLLDSLAKSETETNTVLQNLKAFLGRN